MAGKFLTITRFLGMSKTILFEQYPFVKFDKSLCLKQQKTVSLDLHREVLVSNVQNHVRSLNWGHRVQLQDK